jgi:hypothetical protein
MTLRRPLCDLVAASSALAAAACGRYAGRDWAVTFKAWARAVGISLPFSIPGIPIRFDRRAE